MTDVLPPPTGLTGLFIADNNYITPPEPTVGSIALEVQSTTRAFVLSRMSTVQRDAMVAPVMGMLIYNTTANGVQVFINTGTWTTL